MKFTVKRGKAVVGEMRLRHLGGGDWEIDYLKVQPAFRGQGLASLLQQKAINFAVGRGVTLVSFLDPEPGGLTYEQMVAWKKRHGFRHGWYDFSERKDRRSCNKRAMLFDGWAARQSAR